jgi:hypothetical protein
MKLGQSSTAMANTSHFPVGITGAIVSSDWETMLLASPAKAFETIRTHFQTRLPGETGGNYEYIHRVIQSLFLFDVVSGYVKQLPCP